ncbi:MAG: hypothetical protein J0H75_16530 [Rhizobiales bacterium]|nr:hypothetical protein [Hyphomicrobiales bacterium]
MMLQRRALGSNGAETPCKGFGRSWIACHVGRQREERRLCPAVAFTQGMDGVKFGQKGVAFSANTSAGRPRSSRQCGPAASSDGAETLVMVDGIMKFDLTLQLKDGIVSVPSNRYDRIDRA